MILKYLFVANYINIHINYLPNGTIFSKNPIIYIYKYFVQYKFVNYHIQISCHIGKTYIMEYMFTVHSLQI